MSLFAFHHSGVFPGNDELDATLWYTVYDDATGSWGPDTQLPNVGMAESPSAVIWNGRLHVFHQGGYEDLVTPLGETSLLWFSYFDGANWQPDTQVQTQTTLPFGYTGIMTESPSAVVYGDDLYVFYQGVALAEAGQGPGYLPNGELWYSVYHPGSGWQPDTQVQDLGTGIVDSPSAVVWNGDLHVFYSTYPPYHDYMVEFSRFDGTNWHTNNPVPTIVDGITIVNGVRVVSGGITGSPAVISTG